MKTILARRAPLTRQRAIGPDNTITDRALRLAPQRAHHVPPPRRQAVDQVAVAERDDALRVAQPGLPLCLRDGDAGQAFDGGLAQGVGGWEGDADGHCLLVDEVGGGDFAGAGGDFDGEVFVVGVGGGGGGPGGYGAEGVGDNVGGISGGLLALE